MVKLYAQKRGKRSVFEIYIDVLRVIKRGEYKPTRIMYAANLSWKPLMRILNSLIAQGLINEIEGKRTRYEITEKGRSVLRYLDKARELIVVAQLSG